MREAGVPETAEFVQQTERLKAAHQAMEQLGEEVQMLDLSAALDSRADDLMRRFARAEQERKRSLKQLSVWLEDFR